MAPGEIALERRLSERLRCLYKMYSEAFMSRLKIESARRQLGTALALFLQDHDPVSVHCLAGGGCELIEFYAKKSGAEPFTSSILETNPNADLIGIRKLQRKYWNAFKHATFPHGGEERDDDKVLSQFTDELNDTALYIGWHDYAQAVDALPIEAQVYLAWYLALNIEKLAPDEPREPYNWEFPNIRAMPRAEQKRMLNNSILRVRANAETMSNPQTEKRALILGWP